METKDLLIQNSRDPDDSPERRRLLHDMYASIGRGNDAVAEGDRGAYEREVALQVDLRGLIAGMPPFGLPRFAVSGTERPDEPGDPD